MVFRKKRRYRRRRRRRSSTAVVARRALRVARDVKRQRELKFAAHHATGSSFPNTGPLPWFVISRIATGDNRNEMSGLKARLQFLQLKIKFNLQTGLPYTTVRVVILRTTTYISQMQQVTWNLIYSPNSYLGIMEPKARSIYKVVMDRTLNLCENSSTSTRYLTFNKRLNILYDQSNEGSSAASINSPVRGGLILYVIPSSADSVYAECAFRLYYTDS